MLAQARPDDLRPHGPDTWRCRGGNPLADLFVTLGVPAVVIAKGSRGGGRVARIAAAATSGGTLTWRLAGGLPLALAIAIGLIGGITNTAAFLPRREHVFESSSSGRLRRAPGSAHRARRARTQPQGCHRRVPARPARRHHRPVRHGKSSLAFDTIYAEGQRRYVESLSAYARQFLGQMEKPDVDQIDGLSPAISIDQKGASRNPRSTVGTVTEIYDHLRLLFARIGIPHCPNGHADRAPDRPADRRPGPGAARGHAPARPRPAHQGPQDRRRPGLRRAPGGRASSASASTARWSTSPTRPKLDKYKRHSIEVVVDRYVVRHAEAPEGAARAADGRPIDPETGAGHPGPGRRPAGRLDRDRPAARRGRRPRSRRRRATTSRRRSRSGATARSTAARTTASPSTSSSRAASRSTRRTAPARPAPASAPSSRSTRPCVDPGPVQEPGQRGARAVGARCRPMRRGG